MENSVKIEYTEYTLLVDHTEYDNHLVIILKDKAGEVLEVIEYSDAAEDDNEINPQDN